MSTPIWPPDDTRYTSTRAERDAQRIAELSAQVAQLREALQNLLWAYDTFIVPECGTLETAEEVRAVLKSIPEQP